MPNITIDIPEAFEPLWQPKRYKVLYGGRGSGKSHSIARVLLILGIKKKIRVLCAREIQNSIKESVHQLLESLIGELGLGSYYQVQATQIIGTNGTEFFFSGLKHKIDSIKSAEGIDYCWIEEAHLVSKKSWDRLTPTIRKPGSEIIVSFNPDLDTDETHKRFVKTQPENCWSRKVSYKDNPWFPDELRAEMRDTRLRSEDDFQNIWLGFTKQSLDGAVYANELRKAREEGRITSIPYDHSYPVDTYWDIGHNDLTAIWFIQKIGFDWRVIDYYEDQFKLLPHYVNILQEKKYNYGVDVLPHDAASVQGLANSVAKRFQTQTGRKPLVLPRDPLVNGIDALRTVFPRLWFDEIRCADGLNALRHYAYDVDDEDDGEHKYFSRQPKHNWASHAADALRAFAMAMKTPKNNKPELDLEKPERKKVVQLNFGQRQKQHAWLGR